MSTCSPRIIRGIPRRRSKSPCGKIRWIFSFHLLGVGATSLWKSTGIKKTTGDGR